jgi:hypothetical protein
MLSTNLRMVEDRIRYFRTGGTAWDIEPYRGDGQLLFDWSVAGDHARRYAGGIKYSPTKREVAIIVLPKKYISSKAVLLKYLTSGMLPGTIVKPLKDMDATVGENANIMLRVMNAALQKDEDYYLRRGDSTSCYWQAVDGMYRKQFIPLEPKAAEITESIRLILYGGK